MEKTNATISPVIEEKPLPFHPVVILVILYILGVSVRFVLSFFFRSGPTLTIDESLYISLAQSLAAGEGIAYRSQPIPYMYIFYPLLLIPVYFLRLPFDLYRCVQFLNALLISSSVFPVYLFAKDFTSSRRKALLASLLVLIMPDFQMSGYLMAESVVWPLSLWLIFFSFRLFLLEENRVFYGIMSGLFTALLFWTKPGAVVMGLAILFAALLLSDKQAVHRRRPAALAGLAVCVGAVILFYALYVFGFGYELSLLGLYKKQLTEVSAKWFAAVAEFSVLQLLLFAVACIGVFFAVPYACFREYDLPRRSFLVAFSAGVVALAVGTAAFVDMFLWNGSFVNPQLHLRYMAMYLPVLSVFSLGTAWEKAKKNLLAGLLAVLAVFVIFPGASVGFVEGDYVDGTSTPVDSLALSGWLKSEYLPPWVGIVLTVLLAVFLVFIALQVFRRGASPLLRKYSVGFYIFILLVHNSCGYIAGTVGAESFGYGRDAVEMNALLEALPEKALIITQPKYDDIASYALECRLRSPHQQVPVNAFIKSLSETGGVYTPFVPEDLSPNVGNHSTPETGTFLFGITVADQVEFSPSAAVTTSQDAWFTLVRVPAGERLVDTALLGVDTQTLSEGSQAHLIVFDENRYHNGALSLSLLACAEESPVALIIENAGRTQRISLSSEPFVYNISLRQGDVVITPEGGDALLLSYRTN